MDKKEKRAQRKIKCPQCGVLVIYSPDNPYRPFCSERCKTLDLAQWADGNYRIPVEQSSVPNDSDLNEEDLDKFQ
ncbi:MAG: DNA gyrase inhibitor YacG [Pseudobdellovibrionaceae bacterium]